MKIGLNVVYKLNVRKQIVKDWGNERQYEVDVTCVLLYNVMHCFYLWNGVSHSVVYVIILFIVPIQLIVQT